MKANCQLVIYTDLDGTFLDHRTYAPDMALPALRSAQRHGVPVVFCSSKTRAEIEVLQRQLDVDHPFVVENGGAVYVPIGYFPFELERAERRGAFDVIELGTRYEVLVRELGRLRSLLPYRLAGFSDLIAEEVADVCELSLEEARRAKEREYDEPFRLLAPTPEASLAVRHQIQQAGLQCSSGGRFWHLHGSNDKGLAVKVLSSFYRRAFGRIFTVGLGDSLNDVPLLESVDWPVLVKCPGDRLTRLLRQRFPNLNITQATGPRGWNAALSYVFDRLYAIEGGDIDTRFT